MKICLYLEFYHFWNGRLFKNLGTGLLSSYKNQKRILDLAGIPYTEYWDDSCDILQINTPWLRSRYLIRKARKRGMKIIIFSHVTAEDAMQVFRFMPLIAPAFKWYLKRAYDSADLIISPTEYTKSLLINYGISGKKIIVRSNGVDTDKFYEDAEKRESFRKERAVEGIAVGTVGLVIPRKGIDTFLSLGEKFPDVPFYWFGKIYSSLVVKPLPKRISGNVHFTGYVPDILAAFNALDVFIFPSHEENQGMVILEAAAVGLPILVRDLPAYRGWLRDEDNCLKAKNDGDFVLLLQRLMADGGLRARLSANAKKLAERESLKNLAESAPALYGDPLQPGGLTGRDAASVDKISL